MYSPTQRLHELSVASCHVGPSRPPASPSSLTLRMTSQPSCSFRLGGSCSVSSPRSTHFACSSSPRSCSPEDALLLSSSAASSATYMLSGTSWKHGRNRYLIVPSAAGQQQQPYDEDDYPLEIPTKFELMQRPDKQKPLVRVRLSVHFRVHSRQMLCIGGSQIPMGWSFLSISRVPMTWNSGDIWTVEVGHKKTTS